MAFQSLYRSIPLFTPFEGLIAVESLRHGGISPAPYNSLNLGLYTDDRLAHVHQNKARFCAALGISSDQIADAHQIHGDRILVVEQAGHFEGYDGLVSQQSNLFLSVTIADCMPLLLFDSRQKVVAAVHAGWRGTVAQIAVKCLSTMQREFGCRPADCYAWLGTCIDECSFETDADVADHFAEAHKRWDEPSGKFFIDLKQANQSQLTEAGVPISQIEKSPYSTVLHNNDYFSYRKEGGKTGRMLALIGMIPQ